MLVVRVAIDTYCARIRLQQLVPHNIQRSKTRLGLIRQLAIRGKDAEVCVAGAEHDGGCVHEEGGGFEGEYTA